MATTTAGNCISKHKATTKVGTTPRRQTTTTINASKEPAAQTAATRNFKCQVATTVCKFPNQGGHKVGTLPRTRPPVGLFASHIQWVITVGTLTCTCHHGCLVAWKCVQRLGLALEKCTYRCGHGSWKCICARLGSFTYIPSWLPGSWKKHYCMKHLFAWFLEVCVMVTRFLCEYSGYLALWCMVLGTVPAAMIYNSVYNARSWRRLVLGSFS